MFFCLWILFSLMNKPFTNISNNFQSLVHNMRLPCAAGGHPRSPRLVADILATIWFILFISSCPRSLAISKNFVNSSMPEMRPTFVVNFDMATVICQHSEGWLINYIFQKILRRNISDATDLHLHEISILCDGSPDCFSNPAMHDESFPYCGPSFFSFSRISVSVESFGIWNANVPTQTTRTLYQGRMIVEWPQNTVSVRHEFFSNVKIVITSDNKNLVS